MGIAFVRIVGSVKEIVGAVMVLSSLLSGVLDSEFTVCSIGGHRSRTETSGWLTLCLQHVG